MVSISISRVEIGYGVMSFVRGREHTPASVVQDGNVITHNAEVSGVSDGFDVSFQVSFEAGAEDHSQYNVISLRLPVPNKGADTAYINVELEALQALPQMLRAIADEIDAQTPRGNDIQTQPLNDGRDA